MNIHYFQTYKKLSLTGVSIVRTQIELKKDLLLCAASGNSPLGLYKEMIRTSKKDSKLFEKLRIIKLDEWGGIPIDDSSTCEHYLRKKLLEHLKIPKWSYISFNSKPESLEKECLRIQSILKREGPIDLCILGLGKNGHLGFNEPGPFLQPYCHVAKLTGETLKHSMVQGKTVKPDYGMTLGMKDILSSRKIILIVSGKGKEEAKEALFSSKISTQYPASLLWLHNDVECLVLEE